MKQCLTNFKTVLLIERTPYARINSGSVAHLCLSEIQNAKQQILKATVEFCSF